MTGDGFAEKGDAALTFSIDGLVLAPTEGGVGARLWVADRTAVGASLGFGYSRTEGRFGDDVEGFTSHVAFAVEQHVGRGRRVSPFVGGAVRFGYAAFDGDGGVIVYDDTPEPGCDTRDCPGIPYPEYYGSSATEVSIGGGLLLGAEVRLAERLSLSAAHTVGLTYTRGDGGYGYYYEDLPTEPPTTCDGCEGGGDDLGSIGGDGDYSRFEFGTGTTSLTLSIYF